MQIPKTITWSSIVAGKSSDTAIRLGVNVENLQTKGTHVLKLSAWISSKNNVFLSKVKLYINDEFIETFNCNIEDTNGALWGEDKIALIYYKEIIVDREFEEKIEEFKIRLENLRHFYSDFIDVKTTTNITPLEKVKVYFCKNNDKENPIFKQFKYYNHDLVLLPAYCYNGNLKDFSHWTLGGEKIEVLTNSHMSTQDIVINYVEKDVFHTIKFYTDEGIIIKSVKDGDKIKNYLPSVSEKNGYIFSHWSKEYFGENCYVENEIATENSDYYLVRKPKEIKISYKENYKLIFDNNVIFNQVLIPDIPEEYLLTNSYEKFVYWVNINNEDTTKYYPNLTYTILEDNITLIPHREAVSYHIDIDNSELFFSKMHDKVLTITNHPKYEDFEFKGYSLIKNYNLQEKENNFFVNNNEEVVISSNINKDIILYPMFAKEYKVNYEDGQTSILEVKPGENFYYGFQPKNSNIYRRINSNGEYEYFSHWLLEDNQYYAHIKYDLPLELFNENNELNFNCSFSFEEEVLNHFLISSNENKISIYAANIEENSNSLTNEREGVSYKFFEGNTLQANKVKENDNLHGFYFENNQAIIKANNFIEKDLSSNMLYIGGFDSEIGPDIQKLSLLKNDNNYILTIKN